MMTETEWKHPALTAALLLSVARVYAVSQGVDVPLATQATVSGLLGVSAYVSRYAPEQDNPAVRALTTGSLFGGSMYFVLGNKNVITYAVMGTLAAYTADVLLSN